MQEWVGWSVHEILRTLSTNDNMGHNVETTHKRENHTRPEHMNTRVSSVRTLAGSPTMICQCINKRCGQYSVSARRRDALSITSHKK